MNRILILIFIVYVFYTQNLINNYNEINDSLIIVNDQLLDSCTNSKLDNKETVMYK